MREHFYPNLSQTKKKKKYLEELRCNEKRTAWLFYGSINSHFFSFSPVYGFFRANQKATVLYLQSTKEIAFISKERDGNCNASNLIGPVLLPEKH